MDSRVVMVANRFAAHWAGEFEGGGGAQAAVGVWPLLALLADGAKEPGRGELTAVLGVEAGEAVAAAREVLEKLGSSAGVSAASALWTKADLPVSTAWLDRLPGGAARTLGEDVTAGRERMDAWVRSHTGGWISRIPSGLSQADLLVLTSILLLQTAWVQPFCVGQMPVDDGPWRGRRLESLWRTSSDLDQVEVARTAAGEVTAARIVGGDDFDVVLILGEPDASAAEVLEHGVRLVAGDYQALPGSRLTDGFPGPGLTRKTVEAATPGDHVALHSPKFAVSSNLDLLQTPEVFGLANVTDSRRGHFPGISSKPLAVSRAAQDTAVSFTAKGIESAAAAPVSGTQMGMVATTTSADGENSPEASHRVMQTLFVIDRPFGFVAVHRDSGLILMAGWVEEP